MGSEGYELDCHYNFEVPSTSTAIGTGHSYNHGQYTQLEGVYCVGWVVGLEIIGEHVIPIRYKQPF